MQPFEQMRVWQKAFETALEVYRATRHFPADERFGLTLQVRRSVASISANIAEGSMAEHRGDFGRSLNIAEKEAAETTSHLLLARGLEYLDAAAADGLLERLDHVRRMLSALRKRVREAQSAEVARPESTNRRRSR